MNSKSESELLKSISTSKIVFGITIVNTPIMAPMTTKKTSLLSEKSILIVVVVVVIINSTNYLVFQAKASLLHLLRHITRPIIDTYIILLPS
jgi:hypothetical protein